MYVTSNTFNYKANRASRCAGIWCHAPPNIFVGINDQQKITLYNLQQGLRWSLPELDRIICMSPIHRKTGFVVGGQEVAQLVDIPRGLITQVLRQGSGSTSCLL